MNADSSGRRVGLITKVRRAPQGRLIAAAGNTAGACGMLDWLADQSLPRPSWQEQDALNAFALEVLPDSSVMRHEDVGAFPLGIGLAALGTGSAYALAAMACGKSAEEAVEIAARFDVWTGGGVDALALAGDRT